MNARSSNGATNLRRLLTTDHEKLAHLFDELLNAYESGDWTAVRAVWTRFEAGLAAHVQVEEAHILPVIEQYDANEAGALRRDHEGFRKQLAELGVALDLHLVNLQTARALVASLRAHAAREDALAYQLAAQHLDAPARRAIRAALRDARVPREAARGAHAAH